MRKLAPALLLSAAAFLGLSPLSAETKLPAIKLPPGFKIQIYHDNLPGARSLTLGKNGTLFVGTRDKGNVYAVIDKNKDNRGDETITLLSNMRMPNGVAFYKGDLYIAEINRILQIKDIENNLKKDPPLTIVNDQFPRESSHGWKFIAFGPDGKLYVPVGAPCNICLSENPIYASITRMNPDGSGLELFAQGIRNTVGFDWDPISDELWFTDNGHDLMGNDLPPDELNNAPKKGLHFGYPFCHGKNIPDPEFGKQRKCSDTVAAEQELGPHVAALGMRFYTGQQFPADYYHQIFIAEHGSWNRDKKIGYRVSLVRLKDGKPTSYETFAEGWLTDEKVYGRPVDILVMPDGAILVSDDFAGAVYRISYEKTAPTGAPAR